MATIVINGRTIETPNPEGWQVLDTGEYTARPENFWPIRELEEEPGIDLDSE